MARPETAPQRPSLSSPSALATTTPVKTCVTVSTINHNPESLLIQSGNPGPLQEFFKPIRREIDGPLTVAGFGQSVVTALEDMDFFGIA